MCSGKTGQVRVSFCCEHAQLHLTLCNPMDCSPESFSLLQRASFQQLDSFTTGFPNGSVGKESACKAGDPGLIPGSESTPVEGIGYPIQYSWASLMAQTVKNLSVMWEIWI